MIRAELLDDGMQVGFEGKAAILWLELANLNRSVIKNLVAAGAIKQPVDDSVAKFFATIVRDLHEEGVL